MNKKSILIGVIGLLMIFGATQVANAGIFDWFFNKLQPQETQPQETMGALYIFRPSQIGTSPTEGYVLQINNATSTWVATSSLGIAGGSGTVTSVALTTPTGLTITGSPITTSGTLALTLTSGYVIPLSASTTNWTSAYDWTNAGHTNWDTAYTNRITSANYPLSISSNVLSTALSTSTLLSISSLAKGNFLVGNDAGISQATSTIFISSTGNVGIGTTNPTQKLHVAGYIKQNQAISCSLYADGDGNIVCTSDERLKNIQGSFSAGLDAIAQINPILFYYKKDSPDNLIAGFSAQNIKEFIPYAAVEQPSGYLGLNDYPIMAAMVNAIKELDQRTKGVETTEQGDLTITGNVGIGTTSPGMKFAVQGDALADSWNVYSDIYKGDALTKLKGIKAETGTGDWVKVDHNSLPAGILKNNPISNYESFYEPIQNELATTEYKKKSDGTIISEEVYSKLTEAEKGKTNTWILQTMSISGLTQMNTRAIIQLQEQIDILKGIKLGSIIQGNYVPDKEKIKTEIKDELRPEIKQMISDEIDKRINEMSLWDLIKMKL